MTKTVFTADRFTATQYSTAEEKARFCAAFVRFVLRGFARKLFKPEFYRRLSNIFGHIANYDETGFWEVWFSTPAKQRQFVRRIHEWVPVGDPHFCWSDVERELKSWAATEAEAIEAVLAENERKVRRGGAGRDRPPSRPCQQDPPAVQGGGEEQQHRVLRSQAVYHGRRGWQRLESPSHLPIPLGDRAGRQRAAG